MRTPRSKRTNRTNMQSLIKNAHTITAIGRHGNKDTTGDLSPKGRRQSAWSGKNLPSGHFLVVRAGSAPARLPSTARELHAAFPGKKSDQIEFRNELNLDFLTNPKLSEGLIAAHGEAGALAEWMQGRVSEQVMENPQSVGKRKLREIMNASANLNRQQMQGLKPFVANVTSSWTEAAILKVLGIDYAAIKPSKRQSKINPATQGQTLRETEALLFFHLPDGRIILRYRRKAFDVTKALAKALT